MTILLILTLFFIGVAIWSSANEVNVHVEHHQAEISSKKTVPEHQGQMMYNYRHGYLNEMEHTYENKQPIFNQEIEIKTMDPAGPGILNVQNSHIYHEVDHGEKVILEVRKIIKKHKITKKTSTKIQPVSILKSNGKKLHF